MKMFLSLVVAFAAANPLMGSFETAVDQVNRGPPTGCTMECFKTLQTEIDGCIAADGTPREEATCIRASLNKWINGIKACVNAQAVEDEITFQDGCVKKCFKNVEAEIAVCQNGGGSEQEEVLCVRAAVNIFVKCELACHEDPSNVNQLVKKVNRGPPTPTGCAMGCFKNIETEITACQEENSTPQEEATCMRAAINNWVSCVGACASASAVEDNRGPPAPTGCTIAAFKTFEEEVTVCIETDGTTQDEATCTRAAINKWAKSFGACIPEGLTTVQDADDNACALACTKKLTATVEQHCDSLDTSFDKVTCVVDGCFDWFTCLDICYPVTA